MPFLTEARIAAGIVLAREHVGVGHARHRDVGIGLAAAVAGRLHAHQPGVLAVLHVADEDAVLDQRRRVGRRALVVDGERAAAERDGAVIDDGHAGRGDALAHQAGEGAFLLAVEVALEAVADRLVEEDARPARAEHHVEGPGGRRHRREIDQRLAERLVDGGVPHVLGDEALEALAAAHAMRAGLLAVAVADDHRDVDPHQRADVAHQRAVGAQNLDRLRTSRRARRSPGGRARPCRGRRHRSSRAASPSSAKLGPSSGFSSP